MSQKPLKFRPRLDGEVFYSKLYRSGKLRSYALGFVRGVPLTLAGCSEPAGSPKGRQPLADKKDASVDKKREASFLIE
jgi:hypothetical protein